MAFTSNAVRRLDANGLLGGRPKAPAGSQFAARIAFSGFTEKLGRENLDNQCRRCIQVIVIRRWTR
jgi:hypothetical protein